MLGDVLCSDCRFGNTPAMHHGLGGIPTCGFTVQEEEDYALGDHNTLNFSSLSSRLLKLSHHIN